MQEMCRGRGATPPSPLLCAMIATTLIPSSPAPFPYPSTGTLWSEKETTDIDRSRDRDRETKTGVWGRGGVVSALSDTVSPFPTPLLPFPHTLLTPPHPLLTSASLLHFHVTPSSLPPPASFFYYPLSNPNTTPQDVISPGVRGMHPMPPGLYSDLPPYPPLSAAAGRDGSVAPGVPSGPADAAAGAADAAADAAAEVLGMLAARVWGGGDGGDGGRSMSEVLQPLLAGPLAAHMSAVHWMDAVLAAPPPPPPPPRRTASGPGVQIPPPDQAINGDAAAAAATAAAEGGEKIKGVVRRVVGAGISCVEKRVLHMVGTNLPICSVCQPISAAAQERRDQGRGYLRTLALLSFENKGRRFTHTSFIII
jgi:hypothetical protein